MIGESVILGTLLYGDEKLKHIALNGIQGYHFSGGFNRVIFEACKSSESKFGDISKGTVGELIQEDDEGFDTGFLDDFKNHRAKDLKEIEGHCDNIVDKYTKDAIIQQLDNIILDEHEYESAKDVITDAESVLSGMATDIGIPGLTHSEMVERDKNQPRYEKLDFGDPFWNQTFFSNCGGHKGQMTTLFGDSKHGKSMAGMMFARLLIDNGYKGLYTSFEDKDRKYSDHVLAGLKNKDRIDNLIVTDQAQGCNTIDDIVTTAKYHNATNDISFLVVDNAQIVNVEGLDYSDETKRLVTISPRLSRLAIELDIWVLMLSQISNRRSNSASGYDRQPKIHDIYGSGQIRKDSYMGISIFKPSEVDDLIVKNEFNGDVRGVKHPNGNDEIWPLSRVVMKQELIREGEKYWKNVILDITDAGMIRPVNDMATGKAPDHPF